MKTQRRILLVLSVLLLAFGGLVAVTEIVLGGVLGSLVALTAAAAAVAIYLGLIRPWQVRQHRVQAGDRSFNPSSGGPPSVLTACTPHLTRPVAIQRLTVTGKVTGDPLPLVTGAMS